MIVLMASLVMADYFCPKEKTGEHCREDGCGDGQQGCLEDAPILMEVILGEVVRGKGGGYSLR